MKLKDKIKSYSFWVSLASAVVLILKVLGARFGFTVDEGMLSDLFTAMCSVLVLLGIIVVPSNSNTTKLGDINSLLNNETKPQDNPTTTENTLEQALNENEIMNEVELLTDNSIDDIANCSSNTSTENNVNSNEDSEGDAAYENLSTVINETPTIETCEHCQTELTNCLVDEFENKAMNFDSMENSNTNFTTPENSTDTENQPFDEDENILNTESNPTTEYANENLASELKQTLETVRNKYSNNLQDYILELESELQNLRDKQN